jgi:hypothetical protein
MPKTALLVSLMFEEDELTLILAQVAPELI